jgi:hypothetical protein
MWSVKLTAHLHLVLKLILSAVPPFSLVSLLGDT